MKIAMVTKETAGKQSALYGTVVERAIAQMTRMIQQGRFRLDEKLPSEFELMEELQVSRNSLREAMKILSAMGIVDIRRGDGTYICQRIKPSVLDSITYSMLLESSTEQEIVELRQLLDEDVLMLALQNASDDQIQVLQEMIFQMRYNFEIGEVSKAASLDYQFHMYLTDCACNRFLTRIVSGVYKVFEGSIEQNIRTEELFAKAAEHHQSIVDCLKARDASMVADVVEKSLSSWKQNVRQKLDS